MRLETLNRFDSSTAKAILATVALRRRFVPMPWGDGKYADEADELVKEIEQRLNISSSDENYDEALQEFISKQVVSEIMGDTDVNTVIARMGARGRLPISSYKVTFEKTNRTIEAENKKYIARAIAGARDVQHITVKESEYSDPHTGVTITVVPQDEGKKSEHWLVILALRQGINLQVREAVRVYPDIVDVSGANGPLDLFKAFIEHYGLAFGIEGRRGAKFYEYVPMSGVEPNPIIEKPLTTDLYHINVCGATKGLEVGSDDIEFPDSFVPEESLVLIAYCLNITIYMRDKLMKTRRGR